MKRMKKMRNMKIRQVLNGMQCENAAKEAANLSRQQTFNGCKHIKKPKISSHHENIARKLNSNHNGDHNDNHCHYNHELSFKNSLSKRKLIVKLKNATKNNNLVFLISLFSVAIFWSFFVKNLECQNVIVGSNENGDDNGDLPAGIEHIELGRRLIQTPSAADLISGLDNHRPVIGTEPVVSKTDAASTSYFVIGEQANRQQLDSTSASSRSVRQTVETASSSGEPSSLQGDTLLAQAASISGTATTNNATPDDDRDDANLFSQSFDYHANMPIITKRELANAIKQATQNVRKLKDSIEVNLFNNQLVMEAGSTSWLANSMFHKVTNDLKAINQTNQALISEEATRMLAKQYKLNRIQTLRGLPLISVDQTNLGKLCQRSSRSFNCVAGRYRSLSGHCNNVQNPDWGSEQTALVRYAPARYQDNVSRPIKSSRVPITGVNNNKLVVNSVLPSSRAVSMALYSASQQQNANTNSTTDNNNNNQPLIGAQHSHMTTMMSFFGQFVFHDLAYINQYSGFGSTLIKCCDVNSNAQHPECLPIEYKDTEQSYCLDYVRSMPAIRSGCNLGHRDQLNLVSSFIDGSTIYGSNEEQMRRLRTFVGGKLRSQKWPISSTGGGQQQQQQQFLELLPQIDFNINNDNSTVLDTIWSAIAEDCRLMAQMKKQQRTSRNSNNNNNQDDLTTSDTAARCFQSGDTRVNENIGLTLMHTIWIREHNYIAEKLAQINKHWRDERLFEETRRIVVAELQHITYNELLPSIIGEDVMQRFNLTILSQGYFQGYDPQLNAGISNEVATAVFPFILSTIPNTLERYSDRLEMLGVTNVADTFMDGSDLFKRNKMAQYLMGMISQNAMEPILGVMPMTMDMQSATTATRSDQPPQRSRRASSSTSTSTSTSTTSNDILIPPQVDIVALTIQQGRDHGLKSYLYWRQVCQLKPKITSWSDLKLVMPENVVRQLRQVYSGIEQLDLYLAVLEIPLPGATIGPTFVCLLARQFFHLKHGDRYWYENDLPSTSFTPKQLEQIRQTSLAQVMCRNSQSTINFIQPSPMITSDPYLNAYQYCTNKAMTNLDLIKWKQPVTSAQQITDELLMSDLDSLESSALSLVRGKRLVEANAHLIRQSLERAKRELDNLAYKEMVKFRNRRSTTMLNHQQSRSSKNSKTNLAHSGKASKLFHHHTMMTTSSHAGYRYLPRLKRQTLKLNNQSLIFELATNEVVRSLLNQGKDREHAQSIQSDIRDFLHSLESIQLDNLLDNSGESIKLNEFISTAGGAFLTDEQRLRLAKSGDSILNSDPLVDFNSQPNTVLVNSGDQRSNSVSANCQDDDRAYPCDHTTPFRTITGWCNNLNQPKFGQSFTPLDRILANAYEDGLSKPRQFSVVLASKKTGERLKLPSPRLISTTMHDDKSNLHVRYSLALMQFGQFGVDHDLTRTPFSVAIDGSLFDCSPCDSKQTVHRDCLPIEIPEDDAHFNSQKARELATTTTTTSTSTSSKKCLHFVRSLNGQSGLGPRQQINALTAYIDASNIYGSDNCEAKSLRSFVGGKLNTSTYPGNNQQVKDILPVTKANPECVTPSGYCFHAGDQRASEQPGLTSVHTIFMRLHNSIVTQLSQVNRHWNDEKLYQHGRRIVGAIMQRITYNEFAPRILGLDYMSKFDLILKNVGYSDNYDETCSASILTEFAAAAFRMGHSLIRNAFPLLNEQYKPVGKAFQLRKAFFNSQRILTEPNLIDSILRGIVSTPIETLDNSITEELTNHLFEKPKEPFSGMDLISLNIQRARDHGIAGYNKYRVKCNLTKARNFDDLTGEIPTKLVKRLEKLYASVDDIDLFTGGMSELPVHGGIIGPTLGCIIGMQLSRLKRCDRFWHETSDPFVRFSGPQLAEIRKMSLAKVICQESDNINAIQRNAMDISDHYLNPRVACSSLPTMDFSVWRENLKTCLVNKIKLDLGQTKRVNPCKSCTCTLEGPVCRTVKIDCLRVMKQTNNLSNIMADKSCLVQCAWALDMASLVA